MQWIRGFKLMMASLVVLQAWILVSAQGRTARDGVYTEAQAKRGETVYTQQCAGCHGPDLSGDGQAPSLTGQDFDREWTDMPLNDMALRISTSMPADAPGTLKPAEVADLVAFLLSKSHLPAAQTELPAETDALKAIKFLPAKPQG
jgi:mono/diheme cytochrome c family protein